MNEPSIESSEGHTEGSSPMTNWIQITTRERERNRDRERKCRTEREKGKEEGMKEGRKDTKMKMKAMNMSKVKTGNM